MNGLQNYSYNGIVGQGTFQVNSTNRAFRYGDAVFETIKISQGYPLFYRSHYSRLVRGLDALQIDVYEEFTFVYFLQCIEELVQFASIKNGTLRVQAWRSGKGTYTANSNNFDWLMEFFPAEESNGFFSEETNTYTIDVYKENRKNASSISAFKTSNSLLYVLAAETAKQAKVNNMLLLNDGGKVIETIAENIFIYSDGIVKSPPVTDGCVDGIMRSMIKKLLMWNKIEFIEQSITIDDVKQAQEVFLTNSIQGIIPVSHFGEKQFDNSFSTGLQLTLNERVAQLIDRNMKS